MKNFIKKFLEQETKRAPENFYLVFSKKSWLNYKYFGFTEQELDNADEKGFIQTRHNIDCYLARPLTVKSRG